MTRKPAFGRRAPLRRGGVGGAAGSTEPTRAELERAYSETEAFARAIVAAERRDRRPGLSRGLLGGVAAVAALVLALPYLGGVIGGTGDGAGETQMAAVDVEALSPSELADLAPAAGGAAPSALERWMRDLLE
ncbi:hypothetical protein [Roseospira goensis]|uniref:Uncharacterized protein n=1 Tax=Roseospira goensis TaxID=391922 RepID=A0A7W6WJ32_9PROT|nr:hypothetical protein [Roseospira goensis]MBB4284595.1 hypothetical protein [Roseospira goensis]